MKKVIDLGKIGITLAGEYNDKATYEKLTIVLYKGKSYISTKTTQGVSPEEDIRSWQLVAEAKDAYHMLVDAGKTTLTEEEFLEQLVDATKGRYIVQGNIINAADEEDLTVEHSDLLGIDTLKLANRDNTNGMGYVILRKNKSFAEQVTKENTIYEIRYEFNLNNAEITIPEGCILKFEGGNLKNGIINANSLSIKAADEKIFYNIHFTGNCVYGQFNLDWFVANKNYSILYINQKDSTKEIQEALNSGIQNVLLTNKYYYYISSTITMPSYVAIQGIKQSRSYTRATYSRTPCWYTDKEIVVLRVNASSGPSNKNLAHKLYIDNLDIDRNSPFTELDRKENIATIEILVHDTFIWGSTVNAHLHSEDKSMPTKVDPTNSNYFRGYTGIRVYVDNKKYFTIYDFGGTIEGFYKAFDIDYANDGSWITDGTINTDITGTYGGYIKGSPIRINGRCQTTIDIEDTGDTHPFFNCKGNVVITSLVWDMNNKNGKGYISANPAIQSSNTVQDFINNSINIEGESSMPSSSGANRTAFSRAWKWYDGLSDIMPLIFHKLTYAMHGNYHSEYASSHLLGELVSAHLYDKQNPDELLSLAEFCDNWNYLTAPFSYTNPYIGSLANDKFEAVTLKTSTPTNLRNARIVWKLKESSFLEKAFIKAQILCKTSISIQSYKSDNTLIKETIYSGNETGYTYYNVKTLIKSFPTDNNASYYIIILDYELNSISSKSSVVIPKFALLTNSNLNVVTINGGEVANTLSLGDVRFRNYQNPGRGHWYHILYNSLLSNANEVMSGTNINSKTYLLTVKSSYAYNIAINCTLTDRKYKHGSNILELFQISIIENSVCCNSKYVRVIVYRNSNTWVLYVQRIDLPSHRDNENINLVIVDRITSLSNVSTSSDKEDETFTEITSINSCGTSNQRPILNTYDENFEYYDSSLHKLIRWNGKYWADANNVNIDAKSSGTFAQKPTVENHFISVGFKYFCTDKQTVEGAINGIEIIHKGNNIWVDALGRTIE